MKYTNVVYVLIDITEGKYYLGSKTECCLCDLGGFLSAVAGVVRVAGGGDRQRFCG